MTNDADPGMLVRQWGSDGPWESPEMTAYQNEEHLQRIIADAPDRVPGVPEGAQTVTEFSTSAGPVDVCIVGPDGSITIVECKLESNTERRRMVMGQVLDYASAICLHGEREFREQWSRQGGADLGILGEDGLEQLGRNIREGQIHLCLAVDQIDADLRRLRRRDRCGQGSCVRSIDYLDEGNLPRVDSLRIRPGPRGGTVRAARRYSGQTWNARQPPVWRPPRGWRLFPSVRIAVCADPTVDQHVRTTHGLRMLEVRGSQTPLRLCRTRKFGRAGPSGVRAGLPPRGRRPGQVLASGSPVRRKNQRINRHEPRSR